MPKQQPPKQRGDRLLLLKRSQALADIFRKSDGKRSFTIETLTDAAVKGYPQLFSPRPNASTVTRAVQQLMERLPIAQSTAAKAPYRVEGSPRQLVWTYTPEDTAVEGLERLSDIHERIETLISMAVAAESVSPLIGLRFRDRLVALQERIAQNTLLARDVKRAKTTAAKYSVNALGKKKKTRRGTLRENESAKILRVLDQCVTENLRLRIFHRHEFGQREDMEYVLEPHVLEERNGSVFLVAHVVKPYKHQLKQFKLERIAKAEMLREPIQFEYDSEGKLTGRRWPRDMEELPPFPLEKIMDSMIHNFLPKADEQPLQDIVIHATNKVANWVVEEFINPRQKHQRITLPDGTPGLKVTIDRAYMNDIAPRILGLGGSVKVMEPPALVAEISKRLAAASAQYRPLDDRSLEGGKPAAPAGQRPA